jgi:uncharacterized protein YdeI (YjbR/CyaY-like superfamily)
MTPHFFATPSEFRNWLIKHHNKASELLVGFYKVDSGIPSMTWSQSVDQALCFGWIDGVRRSIDETSYCIRFTPRRPTSIWSDVNIKKIAELTNAGLMTPQGEKAFALRKDHKSRIYSHEKEASELRADLEKQFKKNKNAWKYFVAQAPSYKKVMIHWIMGAKQEKTRQTRLEKTITASEQQKRVM